VSAKVPLDACNTSTQPVTSEATSGAMVLPRGMYIAYQSGDWVLSNGLDEFGSVYLDFRIIVDGTFSARKTLQKSQNIAMAGSEYHPFWIGTPTSVRVLSKAVANSCGEASSNNGIVSFLKVSDS
jgi:hypothetical protein